MLLTMIHPWILMTAFMLFALCMGSFLNVVIYRLPLMMQKIHSHAPFNLALPASHCPHCQKPLRFWHNIPVLSFIFLKGGCAYCHQAISWRYPFVELLTVGLSVMVLMICGWTMTLLPALLFTYFLLALTFIDIDTQLLPDSLTLTLLWIGLAVNSFDLFVPASMAIWGAILGYTLLWLVNSLYYLVRKRDGLGMGDCKLLAALGAWLGASALLPIILVASVLGLLIALVLMALGKLKYDAPLAFGPFLAIAGWGYWIFY